MVVPDEIIIYFSVVL